MIRRSSDARPFRLMLCMCGILAGCSQSDAPDDVVHPVRAPETAGILPVEQALAAPEIAKVHPGTLNDAEIRAAIDAERRCEFRYTRAGRPVLAASKEPGRQPTHGVVKINGYLVELRPSPPEERKAPNGDFALASGPIRIALSPDEDEGTADGRGMLWETNLVFEIGESRKVGYRGYLTCTAQPAVKSQRR